MLTLLPFVVQGAAKSLAHSALPDAPTVYAADRPRWTSLLSRARHTR